MNVAEVQRALTESAARFVAREYDFAQRQRSVAAYGFDRAVWKTFADLGWLALPFIREYGGVGAGCAESTALMRIFGKALVVEPLLSAILFAGRLLQSAGSADQCNKMIPALIRGEQLLACALYEPQGRFDPAYVACRAQRGQHGYVLTGIKTAVLNGAHANVFLVSARTGGAVDEPAGVSLFLVPATAEGIEQQHHQTIDGASAIQLKFNRVVVPATALVGNEHSALSAIRQSIDIAAVDLCAYLLGVMEELLGLTIDYCRTRRQFERALSEFQIIQHRLADMHIACASVQALLAAALQHCDSGSPQAARLIAALKVKTAEAARLVGQGSVQLHGGIGLCEGVNVGQYFKVLTGGTVLFGNADYYLRRFIGTL